MQNIQFLWLILFLGISSANSATFTTYDENLSGYNLATSGQDKKEIDFESLALNDVLTNQFSSSHGITFSDAIGDSLIKDDISSSNPIDDLAVKVKYTSSTYSSFTAIFSEDVSSIGGYFIDNSKVLDVEIYDATNILLASYQVSTTGESGDSGEWWGVVSDEKIISKIIFTASAKNDLFGYDNFTTTSEIPVPMSGWLFVSGLIGLIRVRKEKG